ncbi:MAG: hypothetical protein MHMPM18_003074 [Marteilia pararefringens]
MSNFAKSGQNIDNGERIARGLEEIDVFDRKCLYLVHEVLYKIGEIRDDFYEAFKDKNFQNRDTQSLGKEQRDGFRMLSCMALLKGFIIQICAVFEEKEDSRKKFPLSKSLVEKMIRDKDKTKEQMREKYIEQLEKYVSKLSESVSLSVNSGGKYMIKFENLPEHPKEYFILLFTQLYSRLIFI